MTRLPRSADRPAELRGLLAAATATPWQSVCYDEIHVPETTAPLGIAPANTHDGALIVAAVNALPAGLDVIEAVRAWRAADFPVDDLCNADCPTIRLRAALDRFDAAE